MMNLALRASLTASLFVAATMAAQPTCYFPDQSIDTRAVPCNATAAETGGASACCLPNDMCYASGACFQGWSGVMYRQGCTDPTFRDPACPKMCLQKGMLNVGIWIPTCEMGSGKACCQVGGSCCNDTSKYFDFKPGNIMAVLNSDGSNRLEAVNVTAAPWNISPTGAVKASGTLGAVVAATGIYAASAANASDDNPNASNTDTGAVPSGAVAAVAILAVLLALSIAAGIYFWVKLRHERQETQTAPVVIHFTETPQPALAAPVQRPEKYELPMNNDGLVELPDRPYRNSSV